LLLHASYQAQRDLTAPAVATAELANRWLDRIDDPWNSEIPSRNPQKVPITRDRLAQ
jgi:hypothetical protein